MCNLSHHVQSISAIYLSRLLLRPLPVPPPVRGLPLPPALFLLAALAGAAAAAQAPPAPPQRRCVLSLHLLVCAAAPVQNHLNQKVQLTDRDQWKSWVAHKGGFL